MIYRKPQRGCRCALRFLCQSKGATLEIILLTPCQAFPSDFDVKHNEFAPTRCLKVNPVTLEWVFKDNDEWVRSFKQRYSRSPKAAEDILNYISRMYAEYMNSEKPAAGFQRIVTKFCCMPDCDFRSKTNSCTARSCTK